MTTSSRIVLVSDWGEELFSGTSVLSSATPEGPPQDAAPETLRSSVFAPDSEPATRRSVRAEGHRAA